MPCRTAAFQLGILGLLARTGPARTARQWCRFCRIHRNARGSECPHNANRTALCPWDSGSARRYRPTLRRSDCRMRRNGRCRFAGPRSRRDRRANHPGSHTDPARRGSLCHRASRSCRSAESRSRGPCTRRRSASARGRRRSRHLQPQPIRRCCSQSRLRRWAVRRRVNVSRDHRKSARFPRGRPPEAARLPRLCRGAATTSTPGNGRFRARPSTRSSIQSGPCCG